MGVAPDFPAAFAKAQAAAGARLPRAGTVFLTVTDSDKSAVGGDRRAAARPRLLRSSRRAARRGRSRAWASRSSALNKLGEGSPHVVDWIERGDVDLVINTPTGTAARADGYEIRRAAIAARHPVHHDDRRRHGRRARDRRRRATASRRCCSLQEIHARRSGPAASGRRVGARVSRPHARAARAPAAAGAERRAATAPTSCSRSPTPDGPAPDPGQFAMLAAAERWGGGADERPFLPRAFSVARRHADGTLDFLLEDVGPGTRPPRRAATRATSCWLLGPLGRGFARAARRRAGRSSSAAASGSRRWRSGATRSGPTALALLGFRDAAHAEGAGAAARRAGRHRRRLASATTAS